MIYFQLQYHSFLSILLYNLNCRLIFYLMYLHIWIKLGIIYVCVWYNICIMTSAIQTQAQGVAPQTQPQDHEPQIDKQQQLQGYNFIKTLGKGNFGKVKLGVHIFTGQYVAIKILEKDLIFEKADIERISRQIKIMKLIRHENIIQLYEIIENTKRLYLIMEYAEGGDLFDLIVKNQKIADRQAANYFSQIILGLQYLHSKGVAHRDMKPENILISKNKIKIADFGLGNFFTQGQMLKTACGSPCYASPQMLQKQPYNPQKIDIWSSGIILYAMSCGYLPFQDEVTTRLYQKIKTNNPRYPKSCSEGLKSILKKILDKNPQTRYTIAQIKQDPWAKQFFQASKTEQFQVNEHKLAKICEIYGINQQQKLANYLRKNKHNNLTTIYYLASKGKIDDVASDEKIKQKGNKQHKQKQEGPKMQQTKIKNEPAIKQGNNNHSVVQGLQKAEINPLDSPIPSQSPKSVSNSNDDFIFKQTISQIQTPSSNALVGTDKKLQTSNNSNNSNNGQINVDKQQRQQTAKKGKNEPLNEQQTKLTEQKKQNSMKNQISFSQLSEFSNQKPSSVASQSKKANKTSQQNDKLYPREEHHNKQDGKQNQLNKIKKNEGNQNLPLPENKQTPKIGQQINILTQEPKVQQKIQQANNFSQATKKIAYISQSQIKVSRTQTSNNLQKNQPKNEDNNINNNDNNNNIKESPVVKKNQTKQKQRDQKLQNNQLKQVLLESKSKLQKQKQSSKQKQKIRQSKGLTKKTSIQHDLNMKKKKTETQPIQPKERHATKLDSSQAEGQKIKYQPQKQKQFSQSGGNYKLTHEKEIKASFNNSSSVKTIERKNSNKQPNNFSYGRKPEQNYGRSVQNVSYQNEKNLPKSQKMDQKQMKKQEQHQQIQPHQSKRRMIKTKYPNTLTPAPRGPLQQQNRPKQPLNQHSHSRDKPLQTKKLIPKQVANQPWLIDAEKIVLCSWPIFSSILQEKGAQGKVEYYSYGKNSIYIVKATLKGIRSIKEIIYKINTGQIQ